VAFIYTLSSAWALEDKNGFAVMWLLGLEHCLAAESCPEAAVFAKDSAN
jgi:hypothetical protein